MSVSVTYKIDGVKEVQGWLARMKVRTMDLTPVMQDFEGRMARSVVLNFQAGGRPRPWPPSKRVSLGGKDKTLMDKGKLLNSVVTRSGKKLVRKIISPNSITIGTNLKYARIHQLGGPAKDTLIRPKKPGGALKIPRFGSTLIEISPKTGRALTRRGKPGFIFARAITLKKGAIPARPFLLFQDEDITYLHRRIKAYTIGGRDALKGSRRL